jgi:hypothetical protein
MIHLRQKPLLGVPVNWSHPLARGLVGCYLMNEGGGDKIYDLSGNQYIGSFASGAAAPVWTPAKFGTGLYFDGSDDWLGQAKCPVSGYPFTLSAWFNTTDTAATSDHHILTLRGVSSDTYYGIAVRYNTFKGIAIARNTNTSYASTLKTVNDGKWHNITAVFESATSRTVYLDGVYQATSTSSVTFSGTAWYVGSRGGAGFFNGLIDNANVWNRALSASEIAQLYREPFCMFDRPSIGLLYTPPTGGQTILDYERSHRGVARGVMVGVA